MLLRSAEAEGRTYGCDSEVDCCCRRVVRVNRERHTEELDVSFDEQGVCFNDLAVDVCFGADEQADGRTTLGLLEGRLEQAVLQTGLVAGEVNFERSSGRRKTGLGFTEAGQLFAAGFRD